VTRSELEHAIRAARDVADDTEVWVFGSQSILGQFPNAPQTLRRSAERTLHRATTRNESTGLHYQRGCRTLRRMVPEDGVPK
jgi:hypothetical protein